MRKLGQHFLANKKFLQKIVDALEIQAGDTIIEIGPGHGSLTAFLDKACADNDALLILIEKDRHLVAELEKQNFQLPIFNFHLNSNDSIYKQKIALIEGDVLKVLPPLIENCKLKIDNSTSYKLVGNIPYYITGRLFRNISELTLKPELCVFTIQKEVAERIRAKPPKMNLLAASIQIWANPKIISTIPPGAFNPPPEVQSVIIKLEFRKQKIENRILKNYYKLARILFKQPRKTILNNLADGWGENKAEIIEKLEKIGIKSALRPQNLDLEKIVELSRIFTLDP